LLLDTIVNPMTFDVLRKMREPRQIEACELMVAASNYSSSYAKALLAATSDEGRLQPQRRGVPAVVTAADLALMERELCEVQRKAASVEHPTDETCSIWRLPRGTSQNCLAGGRSLDISTTTTRK
jgi:hypothetical protein